MLLVRGYQVDIFPVTIDRFMYGSSTNITRAPLTPEIDYRWEMVKSGKFQRVVKKRKTLKTWLP